MRRWSVTHWVGAAGIESPVAEHEVEAESAGEALGLYAPDDWPREDAPDGLTASNPAASPRWCDCWIVTPALAEAEIEAERGGAR